MSVQIEVYRKILDELNDSNVVLIAVSKTKPVEEIMELYAQGQRDFGENYVQELCDKQEQLPKDIRWHFIGHLQSNKVKYIAPFVHLIHGVDSFKLLREINRQGLKSGKVIQVLLQVYVATEETKFGMDREEIFEFASQYLEEKESLSNIIICGLMGMASFTNDHEKLKTEFKSIRKLFEELHKNYFKEDSFSIVSMGMSGDYSIAIEEGSNMVRIGSLIFGSRN